MEGLPHENLKGFYNMLITNLIILLAITYLFASIPWGFIIGKANGTDIRKHGSCSIGATNVTRTIGKPWGILCFFLDFLKGFLPVLFVKTFIPGLLKIPVGLYGITIILVVLATVVGHIYPIYLKFKGGKGIATGTGALVAITPPAIICGLIIWIIIFKVSRYVSLASIIAAIAVAVLTIFFSAINFYSIDVILQCFVVFLSLFAIYKHASNIKRLLNGTENRFTKKNRDSDV